MVMKISIKLVKRLTNTFSSPVIRSMKNLNATQELGREAVLEEPRPQAPCTARERTPRPMAVPACPPAPPDGPEPSAPGRALAQASQPPSEETRPQPRCFPLRR